MRVYLCQIIFGFNKWQSVHCLYRRYLLKLSVAKMSSKNRKRVGDETQEVLSKLRPRRTIKIEMEKEEGDIPNPQVIVKATTSSKRKGVTKNQKTEVEVAEPEQEDLMENNDIEQMPDDDQHLNQFGYIPPAEGEDLLSTSFVGATEKETKTKKEPIKLNPPQQWRTVFENIQLMRADKTAPVDTMGCERTADLTEEPNVQRFQTLVSLMLSSQTKDQVTFAAMERLKERELTVQAMIDIEEVDLAEILKPVGFYKRKANYIKRTAVILQQKFSDDIPDTIEDLCSLPGVGPKMAYICMTAAWNVNAGIGVDTHVHRIANRLRWTGKRGTETPEKTREALESWLPKKHWQEINILLVGFGQEICLPIGPRCKSCLNKHICPSSKAPNIFMNLGQFAAT